MAQPVGVVAGGDVRRWKWTPRVRCSSRADQIISRANADPAGFGPGRPRPANSPSWRMRAEAPERSLLFGLAEQPGSAARDSHVALSRLRMELVRSATIGCGPAVSGSNVATWSLSPDEACPAFSRAASSKPAADVAVHQSLEQTVGRRWLAPCRPLEVTSPAAHRPGSDV